jgi:tetratricopeptide (TPR) repeat protein
MSVAKVLRLDEYRGRRTHRLRLSSALHRVDAHRHAVLQHLVRIADLAGADRVATVWVDEYGAGLIHPHVVFDQVSDRPRRDFSSAPLRAAWELGVPSAYDQPAAPGAVLPAQLAVSLGSDGTRAWFVVAESLFARPMLGADVRSRILFLAGECAALVLHRDLDLVTGDGSTGAAGAFAGSHILEDLEGREADEGESSRIAHRFLVGRLVRSLVEEGLAVAPDRIAEQVRRARKELQAYRTSEDPQGEVERWHRVLDAMERRGHEELASELVGLGDSVEAQGHARGALELYHCAYEVAAALGAYRQAADAARLSGRLLRRQARWEEARKWFEVTREIADVTGLPDVAARALVGLGGIRREMGNLPGARECFHDGLAVAEASGVAEVIGLTHHALLGLEQQVGDLERALEHGWLALASYETDVGRTRCMAGLAGALIDYGDLEAAEDAWSLVVTTAADAYYVMYAHDALGHLCALRGDADGFADHASRCDAMGWEGGPASAKAEILYHRGLSYRALGQLDQAAEWLRRAVRFAEQNRYSRILFKAEEALETLAGRGTDDRTHTQAPAAPREVRDGLRAMRQELAAAGA